MSAHEFDGPQKMFKELDADGDGSPNSQHGRGSPSGDLQCTSIFSRLLPAVPILKPCLNPLPLDILNDSKELVA